MELSMSRIISIAALSVACICIGFFIGWWANSPSFDFMCSKPSVYTLAKGIEAEGINVQSGTEINLRSCEYANRFSISLFYDKGTHSDIFKLKNSAPNIGNHGANEYSVTNIK
jgi:hypothetical protein